MRVALVGPPGSRERLRAQLVDRGMDIAGEFETVAHAVEAALDLDALLVAAEDRAAAPAARRWGEDGVAGEHLTLREIEVLELMAEGLPNRSIAGRLGISDQTVKFHVASILGKLGAGNRTEAVRRAVRRGLISL